MSTDAVVSVWTISFLYWFSFLLRILISHIFFVYFIQTLSFFTCSPHINAIPIDPSISAKVHARMMTMATFDLREVQNPDISIRSVLGEEEEWDNGYFYAEVGGKRLLYKIPQGDSSCAKVPVQFGREVLASVVGNNDLAHWKACEVSKEEEERLATKFREDLDSYRK